MARDRAWRRAQRRRIIDLRASRVRNWQMASSFEAGTSRNPLHPWYQADPWPQADRLGTFARWNPLVCCRFCQIDVFERRPRWRWDRQLPDEPTLPGSRRTAVSAWRWWGRQGSR